jgi:hypothetical protein
MAMALSIFLLSASLLCFEIIVIRLLSISHWQPFVTLAISVALLGYGLSGTVLARTRERVFTARSWVYPVLALAAALSYRPAAAISGRLDLDPGLIIRDPQQWLGVALLIGVLTIPFILAAGALALPLIEARQVGRYYGFNLLGAACGVVVAIFSLVWLDPADLPRVPALLAGISILPGLPRLAKLKKTLVLGIIVLVAMIVSWPAAPISYSPYKDISYARLLPGSTVELEKSGIAGKYQAVSAPAMRSASGLSVAYRGSLPGQAALYRNGDRVGTLNLTVSPGDEGNAYLRWQTAAAPYFIPGTVRRVCIAGFSGGEEAARAILFGSREVTVVEPDRDVLKLVSGHPDLFAPWIFGKERTSLVKESIRSHFRNGVESYDLIVYPATANLAAAAAGLTGTAESFDLTLQGVEAALGSLKPDGLVALTGWNRYPATGRLKTLRLLAGIPALRTGDSFAGRVYLVSGWSTHTILAKVNPFSSSELERLKEFCSSRDFDLIDADGYLADAEEEIGSTLAHLDLSIPTDEKPYPWHSLKLSYLASLMGDQREAALGRVEWGFFFLVMVLVLSSAFAVLALLLSVPGDGSWPGAGFTLYFVGLGAGYMVLEILFIKRSGLVISPPEVCAGLVITSFLVFSGAGSLLAGLAAGRGIVPGMVFPVIIILAVSAYFLLPKVLALPAPLRYLAVFAAAAPAAFAMGYPFVLALTLYRGDRTGAVPWAWAVTGYTSVVGSSLAGVMAVLYGFGSLLLLGCVCYALAGGLFGLVIRE